MSLEKVKILAIGVHPDDIELSCSGTILSQLQVGHKVGLLDLTKGELGTRGSAELRTKEAMNSLKMMQASFRVQLDLGDGFFKNEKNEQLQIIEVLRACQPDIVLANSLKDRHPDHGKAARLIADACFYSGLSKIETFRDSKVQERWRPSLIMHYVQDNYLEPDVVVDISSYIDQKLELIKCFASQFYDSQSTELETPISRKDFLESVLAKNKIFGRLINADYGEAFLSESPIKIKDLNLVL